MVNRFTPKAQAVLTSAKRCAEKMGHSYIGTEHLVLGILCCDCVGKKILEDKRIFYADVYTKLSEIAGVGSEDAQSVRQLTPKCKRVIEGSALCAKSFGSRLIGTEQLLYALCEESDCVGCRILISLGVSPHTVKSEIAALFDTPKDKNEATVSGCPVISQYGKNLNTLARQGKCDPLIGRDEELVRLIQVLSRRTKNNPCLIGEPGVGKTAIVEGLAQRINEGLVPTGLKDKIIVALDLASMVAGAKYRGEFEERLRGVMNEARSNDSIILFIDEIHTIMGAGAAEGAVDAANIIKPALARGDLQVIGATTFEEYRRHIERDSALERRFQPITVNEPSSLDTVDMILGLRERYELYHGVKIPKDVIEHAVKLSVRYINDRFLPDKAIDLIDEACSRAKMKVESSRGRVQELNDEIKECNRQIEVAILNEGIDLAKELRAKESSLCAELSDLLDEGEMTECEAITKGDIDAIVTQWTHIPVCTIEQNEGARLCSLDKVLKEAVIGQDRAVERVAASIKRGRAGLKSPKRPIGSFLFSGPTGVGKTELAKAIAKTVFGGENCLIRLDMSEYMEKHSVSKLIGSPPGYVGFSDGGCLTNAVRQKPYSVVLFDEIEKAHRDVYNILLQILDEGILTDSAGRSVSFKNTILIITSNVGIKETQGHAPMGFSAVNSGEKEAQEQISASLKREFNPELLNRLDEIIVFDYLSLESAQKITKTMLGELAMLCREIGVQLEFDDCVAHLIAKKNYNKEYGARPLRRAIMSLVETPLSEKILIGEIKKGERVRVFCENDEIKLGCLSTI